MLKIVKGEKCYNKFKIMKKEAEDNAVNKYIRERIKEARKDAGESQSELAKILRTTYATISDMERGRTIINAYVLVEIAHHYKKSINYFFPEEATENLSVDYDQHLQRR